MESTLPMTMLVMTSTPSALSLSTSFGNDRLGQTEFRDAIDQHAAGGVQRFEDGDGVALLGQLAGARQAGGAGADDGDLDAVGLRASAAWR